MREEHGTVKFTEILIAISNGIQNCSTRAPNAILKSFDLHCLMVIVLEVIVARAFHRTFNFVPGSNNIHYSLH